MQSGYTINWLGNITQAYCMNNEVQLQSVTQEVCQHNFLEVHWVTCNLQQEKTRNITLYNPLLHFYKSVCWEKTVFKVILNHIPLTINPDNFKWKTKTILLRWSLLPAKFKFFWNSLFIGLKHSGKSSSSIWVSSIFNFQLPTSFTAISKLRQGHYSKWEL